MKNLAKSFLFFLCVTIQCVRGQGFANLNFEQAVISTNGSPPQFVVASSAIPNWTASLGNNTQAYILYNTIALDANIVSIQGTNTSIPFVSPIQGKYSIYLQGGTIADPDTNGAAIMQTAQISGSANSLTYWGGPLAVNFNGQSLFFNSISNAPSFSVWQADISAYAGQTGTLTFYAPWKTSALLDNIQFSSTAVPEPSTWALTVFGTTLLGFYRRKEN